MNNINNTILVKIITPTNISAQIDTHVATFPGEEGEFGVMPNHMPMIISLKPGIVKIIDDNKEEFKYFVFGGVVQIKNQQVNLITEYAENIKLLNKNEIQEKINNLKNLTTMNDADSLSADVSNLRVKYEKDLQYLSALSSFLN